MDSDRIKVLGMSCSHCAARVKKAIDGVEGVERSSVAVGEADVTWDPARTDRDGIVAAIRSAGYSAA